MPARGGGKQQHGPKAGAATLVRSDQDSGMALVKSKDGRTKWLTVSTDPSSSSSITWDERVRTWASMLGVCAAPPSPFLGNASKQGTPLPTPPPNGGSWGEDEEPMKPQQQRQDSNWSYDCSSSAATATATATATAAAAPVATTKPSEDKSKTSATAGKQRCTAPAAGVDAGVGAAAAPASTARRKPSGTGKRAGVGSFARGFLLGLGGGGGGGGGGGASKKSPTVKDKKVAEAKKTAAATAAAATKLKREEFPAVEVAGDEDVAMGELPTSPSPSPSPAPAPAGAEGGDLTGRSRWVKGAPPSPNDSTCSDGVSSSDSERNRGNTLGDPKKEEKLEGGGVPCSPAASSAESAANTPDNADDAAVSTVTVGPDDDSMDWLEAGPGGSSSSSTGKSNGSSGNGTKSTGGGGGGGGGSKKKKKNKSKNKGGGGGGGGGNPAKKLSSCSSSSSASGMMTRSMSQSSSDQAGQGKEQEDPAPAAVVVTATTMSKSKRAKLKQQQKQKAKQQKVQKEKGVTFGHVNLLEFTRDVGGCGVPSDGTWGLALGLPFRETVVDVDGYEASKTEILEERTKELTKKQRHLSTGETRQFDYRPVGEKNPLFARLGEKERSKKLLEYACFHKADLEEADRDKDGNGDSSHSHSGGHGRGGKGASDYDAYSHKVSHAEFVDKSQEASVELTALRDSRRENQGCSCSCVRADKLNLTKLRGELSKRGLKASGSKKELVKVLQEAMRQEEEQNGGKALKACRSDECQCVRDGVECHADLCNCCKGPSIGEKDAHHGGNCGNPDGVYAYSSSVVRSYRGPLVTSKVVPGRERGHGRSDSICSESH